MLQANSPPEGMICISTDTDDLILPVAPNGTLYQSYLGEKLLLPPSLTSLTSGNATGTPDEYLMK